MWILDIVIVFMFVLVLLMGRRTGVTGKNAEAEQGIQPEWFELGQRQKMI